MTKMKIQSTLFLKLFEKGDIKWDVKLYPLVIMLNNSVKTILYRNVRIETR